jgi:hypothetical protein
MTGLIAWLSGEVFDLGLGEAVRKVMENRVASAKEILQDELARAEIGIADAADRDEAAAMVFDYAEAARQGAARRNLRLLAQIMAGALVTPPIYASEFLRWSRMLADLTREELIVLAEWYAAFQHPTAKNNLASIFPAVRGKLLVKRIISEDEELTSILQALGRTGLIVQKSAVGTDIYFTTPRLEHLMRMVRMEEILAEPER